MRLKEEADCNLDDRNRPIPYHIRKKRRKEGKELRGLEDEIYTRCPGTHPRSNQARGPTFYSGTGLLCPALPGDDVLARA